MDITRGLSRADLSYVKLFTNNLPYFLPVGSMTYLEPWRPLLHRRRRRLTLLAENPICNRLVGLFFCLISLGALAGCSSGGGAETGTDLLQDGSYTFSASLAEVESSIEDHIIVPVKINGSPARFILDTGADSFVVSQGLAAALALPQVGTASVNTVAGQSQVAVVRLDSLAAGNVSVSAATALVQNLGDFDGAIGVPFLRHATVVLRYVALNQDGSILNQNGELQFGDPASVSIASLDQGGRFDPGKGGEILSTTVPEFSKVEIEGVEMGAGRIDTGNSGGVTDAAGRLADIAAAKPQTAAVTLTASNGSVDAVAFIASPVMLDQQELTGQYVVSVAGRGVNEQSGDQVLIGSLVLRQYSWVFDLSRGQVWLRRDRPLRYLLGPELN